MCFEIISISAVATVAGHTSQIRQLYNMFWMALMFVMKCSDNKFSVIHA